MPGYLIVLGEVSPLQLCLVILQLFVLQMAREASFLTDIPLKAHPTEPPIV